MLVLSRRVDEVIHIGDQIKVVVKKINGNQVRIGIDAPKQMVILRGELKVRDAQLAEVGELHA